jgi:hypothetical protein
MTEPEGSRNVQRRVQRINWTTIALVAGVGVLALIIAYFASNRNPDQDKLKDAQISQVQPQDGEKRCASKATYDLIKGELFRRAAQLRGSDQAAFDKLSNYASLRAENPVMESENEKLGAVNCSGSLSLDLPPGVAVVGGRHSLMADVDYTIQPAADGSGMVALLRNADAIIAPLATLARTEQPKPEEATDGETSGTASLESNGVSPEEPQPTSPASQSSSATNRPQSFRTSFDCTKARSRGEVAVCSDAGLSALDRNMAAQYRRSVALASPDQRTLLRETGERFVRYVDRCSSNACIGEAYVGRMREIRDIMEGNWTPPR